VPAEHDDDGSTILFCRRNRVDDAAEIARYQHVGERFEKGGEAAILSWRRRKLRGGDFVRTPLDGNRADLREVGFREAAVTVYALGDGK
jgi:hypothetical protein